MSAHPRSDLTPLAAVLNAPPPDELANLLSDEQVIALAALMREAHARQQQQLAAALDHALGYLPRILRGTVRGILFP